METAKGADNTEMIDRCLSRINKKLKFNKVKLEQGVTPIGQANVEQSFCYNGNTK